MHHPNVWRPVRSPTRGTLRNYGYLTLEKLNVINTLDFLIQSLTHQFLVHLGHQPLKSSLVSEGKEFGGFLLSKRPKATHCRNKGMQIQAMSTPDTLAGDGSA
jgi:hypothetical protein